MGSECLENLDVSSWMFVDVEEALLAHLGKNFLNISKLAEVETLSEPMMRRLLQENKEDGSQTILRYAILAKCVEIQDRMRVWGEILCFGVVFRELKIFM